MVASDIRPASSRMDYHPNPRRRPVVLDALAGDPGWRGFTTVRRWTGYPALETEGSRHG
jgi:hypothetical protein